MNEIERRVFKALQELDESRIHDLRMKRDGSFTKIEVWITPDGDETT